MQDLGLSDYVCGMFHSAELGACKPEVDFYTGIEARLPKASSLLLIDDTMANVEAALEAGWHARQWTGDVRLVDFVLAS